jgi:hypothetical protein
MCAFIHGCTCFLQVPTKPLSALSALGVDPSIYGRSLTQIHVTTRGVVYNGVSYVGECTTRTGGYAGHCAQMVLPSYSTAKVGGS